MKRWLLILDAISTSARVMSQQSPCIRLQEPAKEKNIVHSSRQFIVGATCKECSLTVNGLGVKLYPTGAFAYELNLKPGDSAFSLMASSPNGKLISKKLEYNYALPSPPDTIKTLDIASIETMPEGNLFVQSGDKIKIRVKTLPGAKVVAWSKMILYELPTSKTNPVPGIYQGEYTVRESDSFLVAKIPITVTD